MPSRDDGAVALGSRCEDGEAHHSVSIQREAVEWVDTGVTGRERGAMESLDGGGQEFVFSRYWRNNKTRME